MNDKGTRLCDHEGSAGGDLDVCTSGNVVGCRCEDGLDTGRGFSDDVDRCRCRDVLGGGVLDRGLRLYLDGDCPDARGADMVDLGLLDRADRSRSNKFSRADSALNSLGINNDAIAVADSLGDNLIRGRHVDGRGFGADSLGASTVVLRLCDDFIVRLSDGHDNSFGRGGVCARNRGDGLKSRGTNVLSILLLGVEDDDERVILPLRDLAYQKSVKIQLQAFRRTHSKQWDPTEYKQQRKHSKN